MRHSKEKTNLPVLKGINSVCTAAHPGIKIGEAFHTTEQLAISAFSLAAPTSSLISLWCLYGDRDTAVQ